MDGSWPARSVADTGGTLARTRVRITWQGAQGAHGELVVAEVPGRDRLHLPRRDGLQPVDQAIAGIQRQALGPEAAQLLGLVEHRVALVHLAGDPLRLHALQLGLVHAVTRDLR